MCVHFVKRGTPEKSACQLQSAQLGCLTRIAIFVIQVIFEASLPGLRFSGYSKRTCLKLAPNGKVSD
jgi:hypothetical protein